MVIKIRRLCLSLLSLVLSMSLILGMFPMVVQAADQEISADGTYSLSDYTFNAGDTLTVREGLTVTLSGGATDISIICEPDVNLTIDNFGITVNNGYDLSPIAFTGGTANTLTIMGSNTLTAYNNQAALRVEGSTALIIGGSGTLHAGSFQGAAIGSGISADSGVITIAGGNIDAQCSSNGAGIGGGGGHSNGTVNITGGTVSAVSARRGAGIGGGGTDLGTGGSGGIVTISGGSVTATGGSGYTGIGGAGIGGGNSDTGTGGSGGTVTISGGVVNATGRSGGAGIGGGNGGTAGGPGGTVNISDKAGVSATGSGSGYDVGSGAGNTTGGTLFLDGYAILRLRANGINAAATVNTGTVTGTSGGELSGAYYNGAKLPGVVIDWGALNFPSSGTGYTFDGSEVVIGTSGDYVVVGKKSLNYSTVTVSPGLTANIALFNTYMYRDNGFSPLNLQDAAVTATLYGDTEMICNDRPAIWLNTGSDLTIQGSGRLTATSSSAAGIGGDVNGDNGRITIKSGTIAVTGGSLGAGIGGGGSGKGGIIRIEGGNITAAGGTSSTDGGAGIGGGAYADGGNITITGGAVTANGGAGSAGIGGGADINAFVGNGGTINISDGTVTATGGSNGAGIGGGQGGSGGTVNISGGSVYAAGTNGGQDIGYGSGGSGGTVSIAGSAAVFLAKDSGLTPTTTTHRHLTYTEDTDEIFGYAIPGSWTPSFGAYLRVYTLSYNVNNGIGTAPFALTRLYQNTTSVSGGSGLTRENYIFSGWDTAADGSGTAYDEGGTFTFTADTTLFAQWLPVPYSITYDLDGGSVSPANPVSYTVESGSITLHNPQRSGFSFTGWSGTDIDGTSMSVTIPAGSSGNRSFTANWTPANQTMTLMADTSDNDVDHDIVITFEADPGFESGITGVSFSGHALAEGTDYTVGSGSVTLKPSGGNPYLRTPATGDVIITATGYSDSIISQTIKAGSAASMEVTQNIAAPAANDGQFAQQPIITLKDQYGNVCTGDNSTVITAAKKDAGAWTLTGTTASTVSAGAASFANLGATNRLQVNNAQLGFTTGALAEVTSMAVTLPAAVIPDKTLVSVTPPASITGIANGTEKTASALGLPSTVTIFTDDGSVQSSVTWDVYASSYDPSVINMQTFTVDGTVILPSGIVNTNNVSLDVSISVTVNAAIPTDMTLVSIVSPSAITGITNGTAKTASALGLPSTVAIITNYSSAQASVTWAVYASSYDPSIIAMQTFTVDGTVILPANVINPDNIPLSTSISVSVRAGTKASDHRNSSGSSAPSTPLTPKYKADVYAGNGSNMTLPVTVNKNSRSASVDIGTFSGLMSGGQTTVIAVQSVPDVDTYTLYIPVQNLTTPGEQGKIAFKTNYGNVTVPSNMLTGVEGSTGSKAQISIGQGDKNNLPAKVKSTIADKPLIQLSLSIDSKQVDWNNPNAPVTVSIPYTPTTEELADPESIIIWYIDGSGNVATIPNGHYDPATGMVTFSTTHFSYYAVAYNHVCFTDVAAGAWYNKAVSFIAARGITSGTDNGNFNPDAKLTRGEFIVLLMRAYGIAPDMNSSDNFSDAGNTYYTGYLAAAKRLGISTGIGNNMYAPDKEITRQEMLTLLYNALRIIGQLPQDNSDKTLEQFSTTTRAEMAQVLYNLLGE